MRASRSLLGLIVATVVIVAAASFVLAALRPSLSTGGRFVSPLVAVASVELAESSVIVTRGDEAQHVQVVCRSFSSPDGTDRCVRLGRYALECPCRGDGLTVNGAAVPLTPHVVSPSTAAATVLAACSMIRWDDDYLSEWITHHWHLGVHLFVLYSDEPLSSARAATKALLQALQKKFPGLHIVFVDWWPERVEANLYRQFQAMNHCVHSLRRIRVDWVAVFDVDEFFLPGQRTPDSIVEAVARATHNMPRVGSVFVPQAFFGTSALAKPVGGVRERFVFREPEVHAGSYEVIPGKSILVGKSILQPRAFRHMHTTHTADLRDGWTSVTVGDDELRINHYWCKSKDEQMRRERHGASWLSKLANNWSELCEDKFIRVKDDAILRLRAIEAI